MVAEGLEPAISQFPAMHSSTVPHWLPDLQATECGYVATGLVSRVATTADILLSTPTFSCAAALCPVKKHNIYSTSDQHCNFCKRAIGRYEEGLPHLSGTPSWRETVGSTTRRRYWSTSLRKKRTTDGSRRRTKRKPTESSRSCTRTLKKTSKNKKSSLRSRSRYIIWAVEIF